MDFKDRIKKIFGTEVGSYILEYCYDPQLSYVLNRQIISITKFDVFIFKYHNEKTHFSLARLLKEKYPDYEDEIKYYLMINDRKKGKP